MRKILSVIGLAFIVCISQGASGETRYVDGSVSESGDGTSWETAFKTIQEGVDAASDADSVIVADGEYSGEGNADIDFKAKPSPSALRTARPPVPLTAREMAVGCTFAAAKVLTP